MMHVQRDLYCGMTTLTRPLRRLTHPAGAVSVAWLAQVRHLLPPDPAWRRTWDLLLPAERVRWRRRRAGLQTSSLLLPLKD